MKEFDEKKIALVNAKIAKFMGATIEPFKMPDAVVMTWQNCSMEKMNGLDVKYTTLCFHQSWDWLMPVVQKISEVRYKGFPINVTISGHDGAYIAINSSNCADEEYKDDRIIADTMNTNYFINDVEMEYKPIELTWIAIAHFLEWYNKNKESL